MAVLAADLLAALMTAWTANNATGQPLAGILGPFRNRAPTSPAPAKPYCVVTGSSHPSRWENDRKLYVDLVTFRIYHTTAALAEQFIRAVAGVFGTFLPTLAAGAGSVWEVRDTGESWGEEDEGVEWYSITYQYRRDVPR
jgi:hypothetical protein